MKSPLRPAPSSLRLLLRPSFAAALVAPSLAQSALNFSVDWKSPSVSHIDSAHSVPITEADIMRPGPTGTPVVSPGIAISGGDLALQGFSSCQGHASGTPCGIEMDALSDGRDSLFTQGPGGLPPPGASSMMVAPKRRVWFSVDEYAQGSIVQAPTHPQVSTEGTPPSPFAFEASADVFCEIALPPGPLAPGAVPGNNVGVFDGNGLPSSNLFTYAGLDLIEPIPPQAPTPPMNPGDNLDALDIAMPYTTGSPVFFSLDSAFIDPRTGIPNTGTAVMNGFVGGDVLVIPLGSPTKSLYASAHSLGLDLVPPPPGGGPDSDDLDALILHENGVPGFQPSQVPYDWVTGTKDMLIFSVRRGSRVIGKPDSIFGLPIEEGDLLTAPKPMALGGLSIFPGIFIAAENLGLATSRTNGVQYGDDLDAADYEEKPCFDCNKNGVEDAVDIATGASSDANMNGIPDECEDKVVEFCWCPAGSAPCGNFDVSAGCANSTGVGALNSWTGGSVSVANDDLVLTVTRMPHNVSAIMYMTPTSKRPSPFYDGLRCTNVPAYRYALQNSGATGSIGYGPGIVADAATRFPLSGHIDAMEAWYFQCWYRDPTGPCAGLSNLTNVVRVIFQP